MATIEAHDTRNQVPRARIADVIQMNLDSPNKLHAAFKRAFGALLATDNKEFLDVGMLYFMHIFHKVAVAYLGLLVLPMLSYVLSLTQVLQHTRV